MNNKQVALLEEFITQLSKDYQEMFQEIADYAVSLGYTPKRSKTQNFILEFSKSSVKKTIMKLEITDTGRGKTINPGIRLKFYATKEYSEIFKNALKIVIEEFDGKYTGCYGCGRCKGTLQGYRYEYPDGKKVFRCGSELISIYDYSENDIPEIKSLLKEQDRFFMSMI